MTAVGTAGIDILYIVTVSPQVDLPAAGILLLLRTGIIGPVFAQFAKSFYNLP
jgi:hypothetical protein